MCFYYMLYFYLQTRDNHTSESNSFGGGFNGGFSGAPLSGGGGGDDDEESWD